MPEHIAIMHDPYLARVLDGTKTIESRFSRLRVAPYDRAAPGETIWLKRAGGPVVAVARAMAVRQYDDLTPERIAALVERFGSGLRLDPDFVARIRDRRYAVLIWLGEVHPLPAPIPHARRDRRGWVTLERVPWRA